MDIGVIAEGIDESQLVAQPWIFHRDALADRGIRIHLYRAGDTEGFRRGFDAMLLHVWQDWQNPRRFDPQRILPILEHYADYRSRYPETVQIVLNHTDMARRPYATPYWRSGDPVLYRTPAYDRRELAPFPPETIWAYEKIWGESCFSSAAAPVHNAGFIGTASGPSGYRQRVAAATARVGIGICRPERPLNKSQYGAVLAGCRIIVCPRGWGENSSRHWDTWKSGKPMLTDRECDSVEMIPGLRLHAGEHYLVFDDPAEIPDIVSDWTRPSRAADLEQIAQKGREAALSYDALGRIVQFFESTIPGGSQSTLPIGSERRDQAPGQGQPAQGTYRDHATRNRQAAVLSNEAKRACTSGAVRPGHLSKTTGDTLPAVDVIIPARNRAGLILACLGSVRAQTLQPNAVIVVDDGSNDATPEVVEAYAAGWSPLRLIRTVPRGVSHARNIGLKASQAPFVAFLDSDDVWLPEKLERQMALFATANAQTGFVHCACFRISDWEGQSESPQVFRPTMRGDIFGEMIENFYHMTGSASAVVARRDLIERAGGFDETLICGEDLDLWLRLARLSHVDYVPEALVGLRAHGGSAFSQAVRNNPEFVLFQRLKIWSKWAEDIADDSAVVARFRSEAIYVGMANVLRRAPQFGLYGRLKRSDLAMARRLFSGPVDYLQLSHRLRIAFERVSYLVAARLILPNPRLLRLCQVLGGFKHGVRSVHYNETLGR